MYKKKDLLELRRRFTKENCSIQHFCGCYVDSDRNIISRINTKFLTLDDAEYLKWMEIIKKMYVPKELYNKNLYLEASEEFDQEFFMQPVNKGKFEDDWLSSFYETTIAHIDVPGRYLILLWLDSYDVLRQTNDNNKLDESEEVYTYIQCAICPVDLEKPNLAYNPETSEFENKKLNWEVGNPKQGFIYPAFVDRSADRDKMIYYTANPSEPDWEYVEYALGMKPGITTTEYKDMVIELLKKQLEETVYCDKVWMNLSYRCHLCAVDDECSEERQKLYADDLEALLKLDGVDESDAAVIAKNYKLTFENQAYPYYWQLVEDKLVSKHKMIDAYNKQLVVLNKASAFIREKHGTNDLTGEIDSILETKRIM